MDKPNTDAEKMEKTMLRRFNKANTLGKSMMLLMAQMMAAMHEIGGSDNSAENKTA